jgi:hypothetical protein
MALWSGDNDTDLMVANEQGNNAHEISYWFDLV